MVNEQADPGTPTKGGTLTFSGYSAVTTLDPAKAQVAGATGGSELSAIYDVLMRYDPNRAEVSSPSSLQSLEASSDSKTWTLKLRDGVKFSDGTALDSKAVADSINRYVTNKGPQSSLWASKVASIDTPDATTVVFNLVDPWTGIQSMLATGPGMIVAPSAQQGDQFTPIGAGAFTLEKFAPNEELLLAARPDYYDGAPNIDKLKLISIVGAQPTAEALKTGGIDAAYMRTLHPDPGSDRIGLPRLRRHPVARLHRQREHGPGPPGLGCPCPPGDGAGRRSGDAQHPRQQRQGDCPARRSSRTPRRWHNDVAPIGVDPAKAKELLDQAKADGYDGKITFLSIQEPSAQATALAIQAMLNAVGFDAQIEYVTGAGDLVKRMYADHDYDMSTAALSLAEADPYERLYTGIKSGGRNNATRLLRRRNGCSSGQVGCRNHRRGQEGSPGTDPGTRQRDRPVAGVGQRRRTRRVEPERSRTRAEPRRNRALRRSLEVLESLKFTAGPAPVFQRIGAGCERRNEIRGTAVYCELAVRRRRNR